MAVAAQGLVGAGGGGLGGPHHKVAKMPKQVDADERLLGGQACAVQNEVRHGFVGDGGGAAKHSLLLRCGAQAQASRSGASVHGGGPVTEVQ